MSGRVRVNRVVQSLTMLLLIKVSKELLMREGLEGKVFPLRLFATTVVRRATRVMLVLEMLNGVSVVVRRCMLLHNAAVVI